MQIELWPVVNNRDRVLRTAPNTECHSHNLLHRRVAIAVFNNEGQILVKQRVTGDDVFPGLWGISASGHVNAGEKYRAAAIREYLEELKQDLEELPLSLFTYRKKMKVIAPGCHAFTALYTVLDEGPFRPNPKEITKIEFINPEKLRKQLESKEKNMTPHSLIILKALGVL